MGTCSSCEATAVSSTSKVILPDGTLQEYTGYVRVFQVLRKVPGDMFLCNADEMEFDGQVSAIGSEEHLQSGQIYFCLPKSMLKRRIRSEDMAALAVRASSALIRSGAIAGVVERKGEVRSGCKKGAVVPMEERKKRTRGFSAELTVITE